MFGTVLTGIIAIVVLALLGIYKVGKSVFD